MSIQAIFYSKGSDVVTISPDASVKNAADKLVEHNIAGLVVVEAGAILGVVSEREIVHAYSRRGSNLDAVAVRDILSPEVVTVSPNDSLKRAMALFTRHRKLHLPVLRNGKLAGLISIGDVIKHRLEDLELEPLGSATTVLQSIHGTRPFITPPFVKAPSRFSIPTDRQPVRTQAHVELQL